MIYAVRDPSKRTDTEKSLSSEIDIWLSFSVFWTTKQKEQQVWIPVGFPTFEIKKQWQGKGEDTNLNPGAFQAIINTTLFNSVHLHFIVLQ